MILEGVTAVMQIELTKDIMQKKQQKKHTHNPENAMP